MDSSASVAATDLASLNLPDQELVDYIMTKTSYDNPDFVAASIVAARYDDPNVPQDILQLLHAQPEGELSAESADDAPAGALRGGGEGYPTECYESCEAHYTEPRTEQDKKDLRDCLDRCDR